MTALMFSSLSNDGCVAKVHRLARYLYKAPRSMASGLSEGGNSPLWWSTPIQFNGGVAACAEVLFLKEILTFAGRPVTMEVYLDSSAARGVFQRQGVGRIRCLEVKSLR